ncbi:hypothetical protein JW707_04415 [Candidatus Woesearchaeota archaeon]|nr:hypothetical protein [Candidatus Woesearchaeota archaeon]
MTSPWENWSCEARAFDGENYSSYSMSENLTVLLSQIKEGAVPMNSGIPFWTNTSNPYTIELNASQWQVVTWHVNATGNVGTVHEFYAYANKTGNMSVSNTTPTINITIQSPTEKEAYMIEGIFEPLCCSGGGSGCDASPDSAADINCETGSALLGTHMHEFNITFTGITAPAGTAYCNITLSNGSILQISKTHAGVSDGNLTFNYTVQNMSYGAIDREIPWILTGCDLNDTADSFASLNQLIFVHNNSWSGLVGGGDMSKSLGCYLSQLGQYFNNSVKCHWEGDLVFSSAKSKYNTVEMECHDGIDNDGDTAIDCSDPDCLGIAYFTCPNSSEYFTNHPELVTPYPYDNFGGLSFGSQGAFEEEFKASAATCSSATNICTGTISVGGKSVPYAYTYSIKPAGTLKVRFNMGSVTGSTYETSNAINNLNTFATYGKYAYSSGASTLSTDVLGVNNVSYQTKEVIGATKTVDQVMYVNYTSTSTETFELVVGYGGSATPESNLNLIVSSSAPTNWNENDSNLPHTTTQYIYGTITSSHSCNDNVDNDLDFSGQFDCRDSDCYGEQIGVTSNGDAIRCEAAESTCWDGFDNDGDGNVDCEDSDCNGKIGAYYSGATPVKYYNATSLTAYCEYGSTAEGTANYSSSPSSCNDTFNNDADYGNQYSNFYCDGSYSDCRGKSIDCFDSYSCWGRNNTVSSLGGICPLREDQCNDTIDNDYDADLMGGSANWKSLFIPDPLVSTTGADCDDYDCYGLGSCPTNESSSASWCFDGKDNDLDAYYWNGASYVQNTSTGFDCDDPNCLGVVNPSNPSQVCMSKEFVIGSFDYCWDALDNDYDTKASCTDNQIDRNNATKVATNIGNLTNSDCWAMYDACDPCPSIENYTYDSCADNQNNDNDAATNGNYGSGGTDCRDADCAGELATYSGTTCSSENTVEQCTDGKDNDGNSAVDCSDADCDNVGICERNTEDTCNDGYDNDYDGYADCADTNCYGLSGCINSNNGAEWNYSSCITVPHTASGTIGGDGSVTYSHLDRLYINNNYTLTLSSSQSHTSLSIFIAENDAAWGKRFPYNTTQCTLIDNEEGLQWLPESTGYAGKIQYIGTLASFTVTLTCNTSSTPQVARSYAVEVNAQPNNEIKSSTLTTQLYENTAPTVSEVEVGGNISNVVTVGYGTNLDLKAKPSADSSGICGCYYTINGAAQPITSSACTITTGAITQDYPSYVVNVSARDGADNTGPVYNNPAFQVNVTPIETTSTYKLSRAFYNSTNYTSMDIGTFSFTTGSQDNWTATNCNLIIENSSKQEVYRTTATKGGSSNTLTCSGTVALPSNITTKDGMYFIRVNVTDSDGDTILSKRKVFYVCNSIHSSGTGWTCAKADLDNDGITEGLYTDVYNGTPQICDTCPGITNLKKDDNGNGYDDACEPEEEGHDDDDPGKCEDKCVAGEIECRGQNIFECRDTNADGCDEWALKQTCPSTDECKIVDGTATCVCVENWLCDDWGECSPIGIKERYCEDIHACGTEENMPETERSCIEGPEVEEPAAPALNEGEGAGVVSCVAVARKQKLPEIHSLDPAELMEMISIPFGYEIIKSPFRLDCSGEYVEMTISVPEDYGDIRALRCSGADCSPLTYEKQDDFICGTEWSVARTEVRNTTSIKADEIEPIKKEEGKITDKNRVLESGKTKAEFYGELPPVISAAISAPNFDVHQPKNPSLSIVGTPILLKVDTSFIGAVPVKVTLPYLITEEYDEESIAVYASVIEEGVYKWDYLDGEIDPENKTVTVDISDVTKYLNGKKEVMLAPLGVMCETCGISRFEEVYHYPGSRNAVILVHGLDSSPATFNLLIDDFRFNNQPWQVWTLSYSSTRKIETTAEEFANYLQMHSNEYDTISIVGHSLGAIIAQQALHYSDLERVKDPDSYSYLDKVRRAVLIAAPNKGSPGAEVYLNLYKYLSAFNESYSLFNANSEVIKELAMGRVVPRVRGVKYYVLAGTRPMDINAGLFKISTEEIFDFFMKNDGIVSTESAQFVGGEPVNNTCVDYWEINTTHTEIIDNPLARRFVERVLSESISQDAVGQGLIGYNQYFKLSVNDCSPDDYYFIIGKKIRDIDICDPCNCGDGICGACENQLTCSADCGVIFERDILGPLIIYALLLITFLLTIGYTTKKFVVQVFAGSRWLKAIATFVVLSTAATALYSFNYKAYMGLAYISIAFIVSYLTLMEIWAVKSGFNRWLSLKKTAEEIAESEIIFRKFNEKAGQAISWAFKPFKAAKVKIDSMFKRGLESDIEDLKKELEKLKRIEKGEKK